MDFAFFFNSFLLGIGLAMDAFSVSLANGMSNSKMRKKEAISIPFVFAVFQALMPIIGWGLVHFAAEHFGKISKYIPFVAFAVLLVVGIKLIYDGRKESGKEDEVKIMSPGLLLVQGIATSIDALSVGFTIYEYSLQNALVCALIIAVTTFFICYAGIIIGKKFGKTLADKATLLGGIIIIAIGIEMLVKGIIGG